jgi:hypothetical protein
MSAEEFLAETESGERVDDPSEDALFEMIEELAEDGDTFFTVEPSRYDTDEAPWYATVALHDDGFEVTTLDSRRDEHDVSVVDDPGTIAAELTIWIAARPAW